MKVLKTFLTFSLVLAFLGSTLGVQVYKHYCGDFLAEVSLYMQTASCAVEGGEEACSKDKSTSCCDDETEFYQLTIDLIKHQQVEQNFSYFPVSVILIAKHFIISDDKESLLVLLAKPPPIDGIPLYKKLQRLTYYG